jgi:hypothetical protein
LAVTTSAPRGVAGQRVYGVLDVNNVDDRLDIVY